MHLRHSPVVLKATRSGGATARVRSATAQVDAHVAPPPTKTGAAFGRERSRRAAACPRAQSHVDGRHELRKVATRRVRSPTAVPVAVADRVRVDVAAALARLARLDAAAHSRRVAPRRVEAVLAHGTWWARGTRSKGAASARTPCARSPARGARLGAQRRPSTKRHGGRATDESAPERRRRPDGGGGGGRLARGHCLHTLE